MAAWSGPTKRSAAGVLVSDATKRSSMAPGAGGRRLLQTIVGSIARRRSRAWPKASRSTSCTQGESMVAQGKNMMGGTLKFFASGNTASMKWIDVKKNNPGEFMTLVQSHMNVSKSAGGSVSNANPAVDIADQIKKFSELRDAGILSEEEFTAKKTDLLNRL